MENSHDEIAVFFTDGMWSFLRSISVGYIYIYIAGSCGIVMFELEIMDMLGYMYSYFFYCG